MKKYSACEDIYPAVECRDDSENRADIFNIISIDGDVELYIASEVHEELRKKNHALWMARARNADLMSCKEFYNEYKREHPYSRWNDVRSAYSYATSFTNWSRWFQYISRTCLAKAKEFE